MNPTDSLCNPLSYHNAGHAVATTLIEREASDVACTTPVHQTRWNAEYETMTALGGIIAERMFLGVVDPVGAKNDIANAFRHISAVAPVPGEQAAYVTFLNARVEYLLERHRDFIQHVAATLEESGAPANDIARADVEKFLLDKTERTSN